MSQMTNPSAIAREFVQTGRCASCPIIDMHGHLGPIGEIYLPAAPVEKMRRALLRAEVRKIVCSPHQALFSHPDGGNRLMQETIDRYPDTFLGYWAVNPNYPEAVRRAGKDISQARGFVGFKCLPDYHAHPITGAGYAPALEVANERRMLVLVHTWGGSGFDSPQMLAEVAQRYPNATFLMGHSGYGDWEAAVRAAHDLPNVYLELTAVYVAHDFGNQPGGSGTPLPFLSCLHVNGIIEHMVERASSGKIVFGTDMPWYSPHYAAGAVLFARITEEDRRNILYRTAEKLLARSGGA